MLSKYFNVFLVSCPHISNLSGKYIRQSRKKPGTIVFRAKKKGLEADVSAIF
jgi:hypothetical protein